MKFKILTQSEIELILDALRLKADMAQDHGDTYAHLSAMSVYYQIKEQLWSEIRGKVSPKP